MNKIKAFIMNKANRTKVIIGGVLAVLLLGVGVYAIVASITANVEKQSSPQGMIETITTMDGIPPASVMLAPASDKWWTNLLQYSSDRNLDKVKYGSIANGAKNIAYSISKGGQYKAVGALGVPTTYVIYETPEQAADAKTMMDSVQISTYLYQNVLIFIPAGAFSDVDYTLASLKDKNTNTIKPVTLSSAKWVINFNDFKEIYSANFAKPADSLAYDAFIATLGVATDTTWEGTSSDGLTWNGKFSNLNMGSVKSPQEIISKLTSAPQSQIDKTKELTKDSTQDVTDISTPLSPKVQRMLPSCCMIISNTDSSVGSYMWEGKGVEGKKLGDKGIFQITVIPNDFLALLAGNTAVYPVSNMGIVQVTVTNVDGSSTVVFTPSIPVTTVAPVEKIDPNGQNLNVVE